MAALVSEYTLEFFTLLDARGKKELIEWCMKEGLIASSYECPKCNEQMGLNERKSVVLDGFEWRCRKKATRGLLAADHVILNHGQVTWTTPELAPPSPNYYTNGRTFQLSTDLTFIAALHDGEFCDKIPPPYSPRGTSMLSIMEEFDPDEVENLLRRGANLNILSKKNDESLHVAVTNQC
ncbi:uncharacterized protein TNCV_4717751 [Trichonephila clavipes]|nr:uncharacterized protein TNCV_4717751 [Trichonephila clavipes]